MTTETKDIKVILIQYLEKTSKSQSQFAAESGFSRQYISNILNGQRVPQKIQTIQKLTNAMKMLVGEE